MAESAGDSPPPGNLHGDGHSYKEGVTEDRDSIPLGEGDDPSSPAELPEEGLGEGGGEAHQKRSKRFCKSKRDRYYKYLAMFRDFIREDPSFDLSKARLPPFIATFESYRTEFLASLEAYRAQILEQGGVAAASSSRSSTDPDAGLPSQLGAAAASSSSFADPAVGGSNILGALGPSSSLASAGSTAVGTGGLGAGVTPSCSSASGAGLMPPCSSVDPSPWGTGALGAAYDQGDGPWHTAYADGSGGWPWSWPGASIPSDVVGTTFFSPALSGPWEPARPVAAATATGGAARQTTPSGAPATSSTARGRMAGVPEWLGVAAAGWHPAPRPPPGLSLAKPDCPKVTSKGMKMEYF